MSIIVSVISCQNNDQGISTYSPDQAFRFQVQVDNNKKLSYSVSWNDSVIIADSRLDFVLSDSSLLCSDLKLDRVETKTHDESWQPVVGEQGSYRDYYNESKLFFTTTNPAVGAFALCVRAYNEGVAFRYEFNQNESLKVRSEATEFAFKNEPDVWVSLRAQSPIERYRLSDLNAIYERPLLAEVDDSLYVALGEAALVDFARMKFVRVEGSSKKLVSALTIEGTDNKPGFVKIPAGEYKTPWRYIMAANSPGGILQNNSLVLNLNEPNKLEDTSWIKPGKVIREVTLTTQGGIACVDFAAKHNLQYIEFDAGWYGNEYDDASDSTTGTVEPKRSPGPLDLQKVINYAKSKGIGVILYVNRRALEKQLDEVLPLFKLWGVAGLKYGFVNVGPQGWTDWLHDAVRKAADSQLMVDIHDEYRPTGYSRTYPNLITQEGIRGDEESTPNDVVINTIFTRMIAGAGDQTNCYFADRVTGMGSHASQMAKAICIYSPWQFVYWYDRPIGSPSKKGGAGGSEGGIPEIEDLSFYDQLPTVWSDTRVIDGYPGEFAIIARKNKGSWFLGAITGTVNFESTIKLNFLESGKEYVATIYSDDSLLNTRTNLRIENMTVTNKVELPVEILRQNGLAIIFSEKTNHL